MNFKWISLTTLNFGAPFTETAQRFRRPYKAAGESGGERGAASAGDWGHQRAAQAEGETTERDCGGHAQLLPGGRAAQEVRAGGQGGRCGGGEVSARGDEEDAGWAGAAQGRAEEERGGEEEEDGSSDAVSDLDLYGTCYLRLELLCKMSVTLHSLSWTDAMSDLDLYCRCYLRLELLCKMSPTLHSLSWTDAMSDLDLYCRCYLRLEQLCQVSVSLQSHSWKKLTFFFLL